jgi:hypothetical protein
MTTKQRRNSSSYKGKAVVPFGEWEVYVETEKQRKNRKSTLRKYGMTLETYEQMKAAQGGKCKCCGDIPTGMRRKVGDPENWKKRYYYDRLVVDHCHTTGRVRHLLCNRCNPMIGMGLEQPKRFDQAHDYVKKECWVYTPHAQV